MSVYDFNPRASPQPYHHTAGSSSRPGSPVSETPYVSIVGPPSPPRSPVQTTANVHMPGYVSGSRPLQSVDRRAQSAAGATSAPAASANVSAPTRAYYEADAAGLIISIVPIHGIQNYIDAWTTPHPQSGIPMSKLPAPSASQTAARTAYFRRGRVHKLVTEHYNGDVSKAIAALPQGDNPRALVKVHAKSRTPAQQAPGSTTHG